MKHFVASMDVYVDKVDNCMNARRDMNVTKADP